MANIQVYNTQLGAGADIPSPRASAGDFGYDTGSALNAVAGAVQAAGQGIYDHAQEQEVSDVRVKMAKLRSKWTVELANRAQTADMGAPDFADKFTQDMQVDFDGLAGQYQTKGAQMALRETSASLAAHFSETAGVYQAQAVGAKAKQNFIEFVDAQQNTLLHDPTQLNEVLTESLVALNDPTGPYSKLPKDQRDLLARQTREQFGKSAVLGLIRIDPEMAKSQLEMGTYDNVLTGESTAILMSQADTAIEGRLIDQARKEAAAKKAIEANQKAIGDSFIQRLVQDPTSLSAEDVINSPLDWREQVTFLNFIRKGLDGTRDDTNTGFTQLFSRVHANPGDPNAITDEKQLYPYVESGELSMDGLSKLRGELAGKNTPEGSIEGQLKKQLFKTAASALTGTNEMLGFKDPKGDENLLRFQTYFLTEFEKQTKAGVPATELLNPDSPKYLGKAIDQFKRTPAQQMQDMMDAASGLGAAVGATPAAPSGDAPALAMPKSKTEYDALPSGTHYIKDGVEKVKP